jgi:hypothetical protein
VSGRSHLDPEDLDDISVGDLVVAADTLTFEPR